MQTPVDLSPYSTILFDFGAVLYDIDARRTQEAFAKLLNGNQVDYSLEKQGKIFELIETGEITPDEFREGLRLFYQFEASDEEIDQAWNAILIGLFPDSEKIVAKLAENFDVALLSNTNIIHFEHFLPEAESLFGRLSKRLLSFEMGTRKPRAEIFTQTLDIIGLPPEKILFIDDNLKNVQIARSLHIPTIQLTNPYELSTILGLSL